MKIDVTRFPVWKKLLFSLIPAFLLLVLFLVVETGVRIAFPSLRNPFLDALSYDGDLWGQINRQYLQKYFPKSIAILPEFKPGIFRFDKPDSTVRIVCLGGSSMFGTPYQMTANIPGIVRKQLRHLAPGKEIEVINLGASAINSNVVRDLLDHVLDLRPTLVLIYMGHNEIYGPEGVGAPPLEKTFPWITRAKYGFRDLAIGTVLSSWVSSQPDRNEGIDRTLMREVSNNSAVRLDSPDAQRIEAMFSANLSAILKNLGEHKIPVIISDVTSNLHFPPFQSDSMLEDGSRFPFDLIDSLKAKGEYGLIAEALKDIALQDTSNALVSFWFGEALHVMGDHERARPYLLWAKELDLLKFRAPEFVNRVIRSEARRHNVPFVSSDSLFQSLDRSRIPQNTLFWEHLHPTAFGYYQIANLFVRKIIDMGLIVPQARIDVPLLPFDPNSLSISWLDLAYADLSMKNLTTHWPFRDYHVNPVVLDKSDSALITIARNVYSLQTGWDVGCFSTAEDFKGRGDTQMAINTYQAMLDEFPYDRTIRYRLANLYKDNGMLTQAAEEYERLLLADPSHISSLTELGLVEVNRGNFDHSIDLLSKAMSIDLKKSAEALSTIHYGLAAAHANKGSIPIALGHVEEALHLNPSYRSAIELRSALLEYQKKSR